MPAPDSDNWRKKYFDSLASIENEQRQFRALEIALKRVTGRLCTAALGQSATLDHELKRLQSAIRGDITSEDLDKITPALSDAIQALDAPVAMSSTPAAAAQPTADPAPTSAAISESMQATLSALLTELRRDSELASRADAIDERLTNAVRIDELPDLLGSLAEIVGERIARIERAKQEVEVLLNHMVGKLDEIGEFVAEQNRAQTESQASSETLNVQLVDDMKAMGETVESAGDLQQIRVQVRGRLNSIDRHLQEFREREAALADSMRLRNDQMRSRIAELEAEAGRLQQQLQHEQKLSTIDALTKVANRLAYDARIDEEFKRWQRFKQPTCLAVWDVDHFKRINDTYGHRAGDRVLQAVADCLSKRIRTTDFLARYGGEEFAMILPGTKLDDALRVVDGLRQAISTIGFHSRGAPVAITISSGITAFQPEDSPGAVFDRADKALYRAKQQGRNCCVSG